MPFERIGRPHPATRPQTTEHLAMTNEAIENLLSEERTFPPPEGFTRQDLRRGQRGPRGFWAQQAAELDWFEEWDTILEWEPPYAKWFVGGKLNVATTASTGTSRPGHGDQVAYHWEGEPGDTRTITYAELLDEVSRRQRAEGAGASARATGSRSTCR
jgi:acetyl-CoA synthetase